MATESTEFRELSADERDLIGFLVGGMLPEELIGRSLANGRVSDMRDGGMGSILFAGPPGRKMGKVLVEADYRDVDDVLVSISVNLDTNGELFELDFWKVDFSVLRKYPKHSELVIKRTV
jgi:hypothetical protein